eukprot:43109_1
MTDNSAFNNIISNIKSFYNDDNNKTAKIALVAVTGSLIAYAAYIYTKNTETTYNPTDDSIDESKNDIAPDIQEENVDRNDSAFEEDESDESDETNNVLKEKEKIIKLKLKAINAMNGIVTLQIENIPTMMLLMFSIFRLDIKVSLQYTSDINNIDHWNEAQFDFKKLNIKKQDDTDKRLTFIHVQVPLYLNEYEMKFRCILKMNDKRDEERFKLIMSDDIDILIPSLLRTTTVCVGDIAVYLSNDSAFSHCCKILQVDETNNSAKIEIFSNLYKSFTDDIKSKIITTNISNIHQESANYHHLIDLYPACLKRELCENILFREKQLSLKQTSYDLYDLFCSISTNIYNNDKLYFKIKKTNYDIDKPYIKQFISMNIIDYLCEKSSQFKWRISCFVDSNGWLKYSYSWKYIMNASISAQQNNIKLPLVENIFITC